MADELVLTEGERDELARVVRASTSEQRLVLRAKAVLLRASGHSYEQIAGKLDMSRQRASRWCRRYANTRFSGIERDEPGRGRKRTVRAEKEAEVIRLTLQELPLGHTHWSLATMAKEAKVSQTTVRRIWHEHGLKPHLFETFKLSNDPAFKEKLEDIVGLYVTHNERRIVLCCDEKSQIQALDRTQPGLPLKKGRAGTMTHDYKRNGTTTLFAALEIVTGRVMGTFAAQHTHVEWLKFLKKLDREMPKDKELHIVCDNYGTHKHPKVLAWLKTKKNRFFLHFTPTSASWLNMVERFFRDLTENAIRRGVFTSVADLQDAITVYLIAHNDKPKPFIWTKKANDILAKVERAKAARAAVQARW